MNELARTNHDFGEQRPSRAVVTTVATVEETGPIELAPLGNVIDPDALDAMFGPRENATFDGRVSFDYCGYEVSVHAGGEVTVRASTDRIPAGAGDE